MATLLKENLPQFIGYASEYRLKNGDTIIISEALTPDHGMEVMAFPSDGNGHVISWREIYCAREEWDDDLCFDVAIESIEAGLERQ